VSKATCVFGVGVRPLFCVCFTVFPDGETQIWPGDLRVVAVLSGFYFFGLPSTMEPRCATYLQLVYLLLSMSGPSLRAKSAATEGKKRPADHPAFLSFFCRLLFLVCFVFFSALFGFLFCSFVWFVFLFLLAS
jgi:hypothetical protein